MQIAEQKDAAIRGLSNYMFMEAQRMAKVCFLTIGSSIFLCQKPRVSCSANSCCCCVLQEDVSSSPTDKFDG